MASCYGHEARARTGAPEPSPRSKALVRPLQGRYVISRSGLGVGRETFAITSSSSTWRAEGHVELSWPVEQRQGYALEIDERTLEPIAFEIWIEIAEASERVRGSRDGDHFAIEMSTLSGERRRRVPYARGTVIDFASPIFNTVALSLIGPSLELGRNVPVRAIAMGIPALEPAVMIQTYRLEGTTGGERTISIAPVGEAHPTMMRVRRDGLPTFVRTWSDRGDPFELALEIAR